MKTIIWDLDGTIIESFGFWCEALSEILPKHGLPAPSLDEFRQHFHGSMHETIGSLICSADEAKVNAIIDEFLVAQDDAYQTVEKFLCDDAVRLLKRAYNKGIKQVLVTNRDHGGRGKGSPHYIIENSELRGLIGDIVTGDAVAFRKPDARVLDDLTHHDFTQEVVVIGDQFVDAQLAQNLGADAILVERNGFDIPHLDRLGEFQQHIKIVKSLDKIHV